jgi:RimJ/RimL family protein N-acetyltransferase
MGTVTRLLRPPPVGMVSPGKARPTDWAAATAGADTVEWTAKHGRVADRGCDTLGTMTVSVTGGDGAYVMRTGRTVLRPWEASDLEPFASLNADAEVMRYFVSPLTRAESDRLARRFIDHFQAHGFGFWALEIPGTSRLAGFVGLMHVSFSASFTPAVEIGWRLARPMWGRGYASEAARAAVRFGFERLGLAEIVACAVPGNARSRAVMERIGMVHDPVGDFDHPLVPAGHPLRRHVLYRLKIPALAM